VLREFTLEGSHGLGGRSLSLLEALSSGPWAVPCPVLAVGASVFASTVDRDPQPLPWPLSPLAST
jgi:hypothetical protein